MSATKFFLAFTQIVFDNRAHSGMIKVDVDNDVTIYECKDWNVEGSCKLHTQVCCLMMPTNSLHICVISSTSSRGRSVIIFKHSA